jgi:hypothetical protein
MFDSFFSELLAGFQEALLSGFLGWITSLLGGFLPSA